ncbi:hypothetical protein K7I13_03025 [Brucepastera parasyntrophica]|uniref:cation-transporting P-type ATPase n=1 Tax=Brucepastera parasyntrophica TaxID=2880008 RepID=UPI00210E289E|nr:cation-transporting P-type ATPase [Brucepastera parasyntrophica]ULQ60298.1 hypothetical protein K7I13_03025 [Brucepastera parasyntrophica]
MAWFQMQISAVLEKLDVDAEQGLSQPAADDRFAKYGANAFEEEKRKDFPQRYCII